MASQGGQQHNNGILPPMRCSFSRSGAEPNGPLPCGQMLLVRITLHPRNGPPKIVYVRKPCLCASGD